MVLEGDLAFFVFSSTGEPVCHVLSKSNASSKRAIVVEANEWHAMTAAPRSLGDDISHLHSPNKSHWT